MSTFPGRGGESNRVASQHLPQGDGDPATSLEKIPLQSGQRCTMAAEKGLVALSFVAPGGHGHCHPHGVMVAAPSGTLHWPCALLWGGVSAHQSGKSGSCVTSPSQALGLMVLWRDGGGWSVPVRQLVPAQKEGAMARVRQASYSSIPLAAAD